MLRSVLRQNGNADPWTPEPDVTAVFSETIFGKVSIDR